MMNKLKFLLLTAVMVSASAYSQDELPSKVDGSRVVYYYDVPPKETVYSITRKFGISREELLRLNPSLVDGLRAGSRIIIKEVNEPQPVEDPEPEVEMNSEVEEAEPPVVSADTAGVSAVDTTRVAVMLPFMLESEGVTRAAQNQINFYRGMLLALESKGSSKFPIQLEAFDTEGNMERIRQRVNRSDFQEFDYIIAPGDSMAIEAIAANADSTGATVVNVFAVKNDAHQRHGSVVQANIPHQQMYDAAIDAFVRQYKGRKVLVLNATDIPADKQSFVDELTETLVHSGIPFEKIDYAGRLSVEELRALPVRDYVAVPTSAAREALLKVLPALTEVGTIELFGYPEWVVIRGDIKDALHKLNARVYSRFSTVLDGEDVAAVNAAYARWFSEEPAQSVPDTMLLGFDTMSWILNSVNNDISVPFRGLQNAFKISEVPDAGDINTALFIITFNPDGRVTAQTL